MTAVVMAKAPRSGQPKTRLHPLLGPAGCAKLQAALIRNVRTIVTDAGLRCVVAVDPPGAAGDMAALIGSSATVFAQSGGDLGERMRHAANTSFGAGAARVVLLGVDAPTLQPRHLAEAVRLLDDGADVVLGPAVDGGYYLLGLRRPVDALFGLERAAWGGPTVLDDTLAIARRHRLAVDLLEPLTDLDTVADATTLLGDPMLPRHIADILCGAADLQSVASR